VETCRSFILVLNCVLLGAFVGSCIDCNKQQKFSLNNDYYWSAAEESFPTLIQVGGRKMEIGPRDRGGNRPARTAVHAHAAANWSGHHERSLGTSRANRRSYAREMPNLASSSGVP
jgi:hypothetical protein